MNTPIRVVLADDHGVVLVGLQTLLGLEKDVEIVAVAVDGLEALDAVREHDPDVLILDLTMPRAGGMDVLTALRADKRRTRTVLLSAVLSEPDIARALHLGARGVLTKDRAAVDIVRCLRVVSSGGYWLEGAHAGGATVASLTAHMQTDDGKTLTARESELANCVAEGMRNAEIARRLGIAEGTVKIHLYRIFKKLDVSSRVELVLALGRTKPA